HLLELITDIPSNALKELWEVSYIASASTPHYFDSFSSDTMNFITISQDVESTTTKLLHYINQLRIGDVYTPTIREHVNKKVQFGAMMSVAKTSIQVAVSKGVTKELTEVLVQFIMKYHHDTGLDIKEISLPPSMFSTKVVEQETLPLNMASEVVELASNLSPALLTTTQITQQPLNDIESSVEEHNEHHTSSSKTCSYRLDKGHNICECSKYKSDLADKKNH
ncbi:3465_t:CDS:2, partial [Cetraspora pellucida]